MRVRDAERAKKHKAKQERERREVIFRGKYLSGWGWPAPRSEAGPSGQAAQGTKSSGRK